MAIAESPSALFDFCADEIVSCGIDQSSCAVRSWRARRVEQSKAVIRGSSPAGLALGFCTIVSVRVKQEAEALVR